MSARTLLQLVGPHFVQRTENNFTLDTDGQAKVLAVIDRQIHVGRAKHVVAAIEELLTLCDQNTASDAALVLVALVLKRKAALKAAGVSDDELGLYDANEPEALDAIEASKHVKHRAPDRTPPFQRAKAN